MSGSLLSRTHGYAVALCLASGAASLAAPSFALAEECPNGVFRTGPSSHLPDCRAYEMVTPPYKDAGFVGLDAIAPDGSSVLLQSSGAFAGLEGFPDISPEPEALYSTRRTASGWVSAALNPPTSEYSPDRQSGFSDAVGRSQDGQTTVYLERGVWQPGNGIDLFARRPDRSIVDIGPTLPPTAPPNSPAELGNRESRLGTQGVSAEASRFFFTIARANYWREFDSTQEDRVSLYEYVGTGNTTPLLVGVDDSGRLISQCGTVLGGVSNGQGGGNPDSTHNAVSTDGNTVFFTAEPSNVAEAGGRPACEGSGLTVPEVFARVDNGLPGAHTVAISEPSLEDCSACKTEAGVRAYAHFEGASADGSKVFFTTTQPLLGNDTSKNLYEYDFDAPPGQRIVRVSSADSTVTNPVAGVTRPPFPRAGVGVSFPLVSEDGSHVYFTATGVLTKISNVEGEAAEAGAENLYVFERDARFPGGRIAFVARGRFEETDVTPDGRFLVFTSTSDLTPDDTSTAAQVFEYDAQTGSLVRVSIGQDGFNHNGNVAIRLKLLPPHEPINAASIVSPDPKYDGGSHPSAYWGNMSVSADGSYVFFQSTVGLTPQALDQQVVSQYEGESVYANNIYEYHAGRVSLISDGQDLATVIQHGTTELIGTDASGGDVFFKTADRLVGQDTDTNVDVYDARIDGGFPAPAVPAACSSDACQGQLSGAPTLLSPGSEFQAGGNPPLAAPAPAAKPAVKSKAKSAKCKKGFVKKKGKCVRAKAKKASRARRATR
jgi:hypothetical protein